MCYSIWLHIIDKGNTYPSILVDQNGLPQFHFRVESYPFLFLHWHLIIGLGFKAKETKVWVLSSFFYGSGMVVFLVTNAHLEDWFIFIAVSRASGLIERCIWGRNIGCAHICCSTVFAAIIIDYRKMKSVGYSVLPEFIFECKILDDSCMGIRF